eukprot:6214182-Pleurochrysis_carterae.AAC.3
MLNTYPRYGYRTHTTRLPYPCPMPPATSYLWYRGLHASLGLITDRHVCACLSVFPVCSLLFNFIPYHDAFAGPRRDTRTHAIARRPHTHSRPPPRELAPKGDTRARLLVSSRLSTATITSVMPDTATTRRVVTRLTCTTPSSPIDVPSATLSLRRLPAMTPTRSSIFAA